MYEDSQPGTLNDFLGAMSEDERSGRRHCVVSELMVEEAARHAWEECEEECFLWRGGGERPRGMLAYQ
ncbi:prophage tail fiber N-terminal domain-containing protein [Escherichia coli]|uniref:prophage tail fiber N-terminal domain-containing protein n=1 Tax=Escherichia coli TaxID=562 RepID=UPI0039E1B11C